MTRTEILAVLGQARRLRLDSGLRLVTVSRALRIEVNALVSWEQGHLPRDHAAAMSYVRVIQGLDRHARIRETPPFTTPYCKRRT